jgi:hypothetical protein
MSISDIMEFPIAGLNIFAARLFGRVENFAGFA